MVVSRKNRKKKQLEEMAMVVVVDLVDRDKDRRVHRQVQRQNNRQQITTLLRCSLFTNPNMPSWHCEPFSPKTSPGEIISRTTGTYTAITIRTGRSFFISWLIYLHQYKERQISFQLTSSFIIIDITER